MENRTPKRSNPKPLKHLAVALEHSSETLCVLRASNGTECHLINAEFGGQDGSASQLLSEFVFDLVFTSPPYADHRKYGDDDRTKIDPDDYVTWMRPKVREVTGLLRRDGNFVININEKIVNGIVHPYVDDLKRALRELGFNLIAKPYIWYKGTALPSSCSRRAIDRYEYLHWFSPGKGIFHRDHVRVPYAPSTQKRVADGKFRALSHRGKQTESRGAEWNLHPDGALPHNVLVLPPETNPRIRHAAPFPLDLPRWFIRAGSLPGEWVLDPFMGSGSTAIAAIEEGRNCVGVELVRETWEYSIARILQHFNGSDDPPPVVIDMAQPVPEPTAPAMEVAA